MKVTTILIESGDDCISVVTKGLDGPTTDVFDSDSDVAEFVSRLIVGE